MTNPPSIADGLRVFTCGHSFHQFVYDILIELAKSAGLTKHHPAGISPIGGSPALLHWQVPDEQNEAKRALRAGIVDVLTLSCMTQPDEGISHFAKLAAAHNPHARVTLQELWLPEDRFPFDPKNRVYTSVEQFDDTPIGHLRKSHAAYFKVMEDYVAAVNAEIGRQVIFTVPDGQATLALREKIIAGNAPSLRKPSDLFCDPWGHPTAPLRALAAYCHFAVIYRRSPVGLPAPSDLASKPNWCDKLNRLLQHLAWNAVTQHPMSGVKA